MCICNYLATSGLNHHFIVGGNQKSNDLATSRPFFFLATFRPDCLKLATFRLALLMGLYSFRLETFQNKITLR